jgi:hypothetical protein
MSTTALKSAKWRFSGLNHQNVDFFGLVPKSPTRTGLICAKILEPNISSLGPFNVYLENIRDCVGRQGLSIDTPLEALYDKK